MAVGGFLSPVCQGDCAPAPTPPLLTAMVATAYCGPSSGKPWKVGNRKAEIDAIPRCCAPEFRWAYLGWCRRGVGLGDHGAGYNACSFLRSGCGSGQAEKQATFPCFFSGFFPPGNVF